MSLKTEYQLADALKRIEELEKRIEALEARRGPGRPKKAENARAH